jgi:hypothetical protein
MAQHGVAGIDHTRPHRHFREPFLLDTNERLEKHNDPRNSFKTNKSADFYSIQSGYRQPSLRAPLDPLPRII